MPLPGLRLTGALLVLVQLAGVAHLSFARHGVCWEHGVVVELAATDAAGPVAEAQAVPGLDGAPAGLGRTDGHPHCPALWLHRQIRPSRAPALTVASPVAVDRAAVLDSVPPPRWAVLQRAPKQSPPV